MITYIHIYIFMYCVCGSHFSSQVVCFFFKLKVFICFLSCVLMYQTLKRSIVAIATAAVMFIHMTCDVASIRKLWWWPCCQNKRLCCLRRFKHPSFTEIKKTDKTKQTFTLHRKRISFNYRNPVVPSPGFNPVLFCRWHDIAPIEVKAATDPNIYCTADRRGDFFTDRFYLWHLTFLSVLLAENSFGK